MKSPITIFVCFLAMAILVGCTSKTIDLSSQSELTEALATSTVGMPIEIEDVILPGSELEPFAETSATEDSDHADAPGVLRVVKATPHGDGFRYSFVFYGLEPGEYDLSEYLVPVVGDSTRELPKIPVKVTTVLPPGQIEPNELKAGELPQLGGYRTRGIVLGLLWMLGLIMLIFGFRKKEIVRTVEERQQVTFADHLRPLLVAASRRELSTAQQSQLERLLLSYWKAKLGVEELSPAKAMAALKADPEAGELIRQLEDWLHRPNPQANVDVDRLLQPYRNVANLKQLRKVEELVQAASVSSSDASEVATS